MRMLLPFAIVLGFLGVSSGLCQIAIRKSETAPGGLAPTQIHQLFFERVARSNPRNPFTFQNDLTDAEMAILDNVATDCDSKLQSLTDQPVVWEARMRSIESGETQEDWMDQRLAELKVRRDRVLGEHVETLRASLGEPRFQVLETAIQDWYNSLRVVNANGTSSGRKK